MVYVSLESGSPSSSFLTMTVRWHSASVAAAWAICSRLCISTQRRSRRADGDRSGRPGPLPCRRRSSSTVTSVLSVLVIVEPVRRDVAAVVDRVAHGRDLEDRIAVRLHIDAGLLHAVDRQRDAVGAISERADLDGQRLAGSNTWSIPLMVNVTSRSSPGFSISTVTVSSKSAQAWA